MSVLGFPWQTRECSELQLGVSKVSLANKDDSIRIVSNLEEQSLSKTETASKTQLPYQFTYIQNLEYQEQPPVSTWTVKDSPVVVQIPQQYQTVKFHVTFHNEMPSEGAILILKRLNKDMSLDKLKDLLVDGKVTESELSRIAISKLVGRSKSIVLSDSFEEVGSGMASISLWYHANEQYIPLFECKVYYLESQVIKSVDTVAPPLKRSNITDVSFTLSQYRKAFGFNIEDGPELRKKLKVHEEGLSDLKRTFYLLHEELRNLEIIMKKLKNSKHKICDLTKSFINGHGNSIMRNMNFDKEFERKFVSMFGIFEANIKFFLTNVMEEKEIHKLVMDEMHSSQAESLKKTFEGNSKDYYSWLKGYLSNEKEKPESKLLLKRKAFVISNFDYLEHLIAPTSNANFLRVLGGLFEFTAADEDFSKSLIEQAYDKPLQKASSSKYYIYINIASQFLNERLQFRNKIVKCKTNEELTNLINHYLLANYPLEKVIVTTSNLQLVFKDYTNSSNEDLVGSSDIEATTPGVDGEMSGILYKLGGKGKPGWHKELAILKDALFTEYSDWRKARTPNSQPIEMVLANVKPVVYEKRQNCFEITTPNGHKHIFQAINEDDLNKWIKAITIAKSLNASKFALLHGGDSVNAQHKKDSHSHSRGPLRPKLNTNLTVSDGGFSSPVSLKSSPVTKNYLAYVRLVPDSNNAVCVDCNSRDAVEWVSINLLCCFCIQCSSCHRNLGTHVSKIRSLVLDYFEGEVEELLNFVNNKSVNEVLEAKLPSGLKPTANSSDEQRLKYVKMKYVEKRFMEASGDKEDVTSSLIRLIQLINMNETLKHFLMGGNINTSVQLANHEQVPLVEYSLRKYIEVEDKSTKKIKKLFVVTEFLVLNGCKLEGIKSLEAALNLTPEAKLYFKNRAAKLGYTITS